MNQNTFVQQYVLIFLSSFAALNSNLLESKDLHPVDVAVTLATKAWESLEEFKKDN